MEDEEREKKQKVQNTEGKQKENNGEKRVFDLLFRSPHHPFTL